MCTRGRLLLATRHAKTFTDTMTGASDNAAVSVLSVVAPRQSFETLRCGRFRDGRPYGSNHRGTTTQLRCG